jgi:hypothetical protein
LVNSSVVVAHDNSTIEMTQDLVPGSFLLVG